MSLTLRKRVHLFVETSNLFGRQIIDGVIRYALERGDWVLQMEEQGVPERYPSWIHHWQGDGIISRTGHSGQVKVFEEVRIPRVELLGDRTGRNPCDILTDSAAIGHTAVDHFLQRGLEKFAFFSIGQSWWSREFCDDFTQFLTERQFNCEVCPLCRKTNKPSLPISFAHEIMEQTADWVASLPKPVGILCSNDSHALYLLNVCIAAGIGVPSEVAVLGIDNNITLCNAATPPLSSISVNGREMGYQAAVLLDRRMQGIPDPPLPIRIPPLHVMTRQSTDLIAINNPLIAQAVQFIRDNATARISVEMVAEHVDLSSRTLVRRFRQLFGKTPEDYILQIRMERAKTLLLHTDLTITAIAQNVGYLSLEYFIRAFKRETGLSPKSYRLRFQIDTSFEPYPNRTDNL